MSHDNLNQKRNIKHGKSAIVNVFHFDFNQKMKVCFWITNSLIINFFSGWRFALMIPSRDLMQCVDILANISCFSYISVTYPLCL